MKTTNNYRLLQLEMLRLMKPEQILLLIPTLEDSYLKLSAEIILANKMQSQRSELRALRVMVVVLSSKVWTLFLSIFE